MQRTYDFTIRDVLKEAWTNVAGTKGVYWEGIGFILAFFILVVMVASLLGYFYGWPIEQTKHVGSLAGSLWAFFVIVPMSTGLSYIGLLRALQKPIKFHDAITAYPLIWEILGPLILTQLIIYCVLFVYGFLVGIIYAMIRSSVPDISDWVNDWTTLLTVINFIIVLLVKIYFALCFCFAPLLILVKRMSVLHAMYYSLMQVHQHIFKLFWVMLITTIVLCISTLLLLVGLVWTFPWSMNVFGILYRIIIGADSSLD